jgi:serine acetyltransferase
MSEPPEFIKIGECNIDPTAQIQLGSIVGKPFRQLLEGSRERESRTTIAAKAYVGYYAIIGCGSTIGENTIIDDRSTIESRVRIGKHSLIIYGAQLCNEVTIGDECVIGGFIGERTVVGNRCRIFGKTVHSQYDPSLGWDDENSMEPSPRINDSVFIGTGAVVVGNISLGPKAYICSGAVVTKNVPAFHIAKGFNEIVHYSKIICPLKTSRFFTDDSA